VSVLTGGCQCGAVRYALSAEPYTEFCHCNMCKRATGGVFAALSGVKKTELTWTRGQPSYFRSSTLSKRGFCAECGTPLSFDYDDKDTIEVTTGSLDHPEKAPVQSHFGVESKLSWLRVNEDLPQKPTGVSASSPVHRPDFASRQDPQR
jgi:hypothetical protein